MCVSAQPATLAAIQGSQPYDTTLAVTPQGTNANLDTPVYQLFQRNNALSYENVTLTVAALDPGSDQTNAPNGTYRVQGGASSGNIIYDAANQPVRTCVVSPPPQNFCLGVQACLDITLCLCICCLHVCIRKVAGICSCVQYTCK